MFLSLLKSSDSGPKPFRYLTFGCIVLDSRRLLVLLGILVFGTPQFQTVMRLKAIKKATKEWRREKRSIQRTRFLISGRG